MFVKKKRTHIQQSFCIYTINKISCRYQYVFKRKLVIFLMLATASIGVRAQYDPSFSHYFDLEPSFNPASVGKRAVINVTAAYALQLAGFSGNPQTAFFAGDIPFYGMKTYHGVGLQLMNDKIGAFSHQRLQGQYALKLKLFGGQLGIGVQAGLLSESLDGSKIDLEDSSDPAFASSELDGNALDMAAGLYYTHGPWYAGLSATHLTAPLIHLGERNELQVDRTYYLTGGYNIRLKNPFLSVQPSLLARTDMVAWRVDVTGRQDDVSRCYVQPQDISDNAGGRLVSRYRSGLQLRVLHLAEPHQRLSRVVCGLSAGHQSGEERQEPTSEREDTLS